MPPPKPASDPFGYRSLARVALPLAATVGCFAITLFTDRTLLMWYGPTSSAASVAAGNLYWAVACIPVTAMGFVTPLVAMEMGKRKRRGASLRVWALIWQTVWLTLMAVPLFALIGWASPLAFLWFDHEPQLVQQESLYFRVLLLAAPASMLEAGLTAFFVGRRKTTPVLRANVVSAVLNVVFDVWFIFGGLSIPALGVFGAALATVLAQWIKIVMFAGLLVARRSFRKYSQTAWRPNRRLIGSIVGPGSTLGLQQLVRSSIFSFLMLAIGAASVSGLAATSAAISLYQLLSIPVIGLATAVTVVAGQGMARGGYGLAMVVARRGLIFGLAAAFAIAALLCLFPGWLLWIPLGGLDATERSVIEPLASKLLLYAALYCIVDVCGLMLASAAKGMSRTVVILVATAVPGVAMLGLGWATAPLGDAAVGHWWRWMIGWSSCQAIILAIAVFSPWGVGWLSRTEPAR